MDRKSQIAMFAKNKNKVNNHLLKIKRNFPSLSGANISVISSDTKINDKEQVGKITRQLVEEGKIKQYKNFKNAFEAILPEDRKKKSVDEILATKGNLNKKQTALIKEYIIKNKSELRKHKNFSVDDIPNDVFFKIKDLNDFGDFQLQLAQLSKKTLKENP